MINRILGWVFTLAVLATVVFAALNWGGYASMCFGDDAEAEVPVEAVVESVEGGESENEEPAAEPLNTETEDSSILEDTTESTL